MSEINALQLRGELMDAWLPVIGVGDTDGTKAGVRLDWGRDPSPEELEKAMEILWNHISPETAAEAASASAAERAAQKAARFDEVIGIDATLSAGEINAGKLHQELATAGLPIIGVSDTDGTKENARIDFERELTLEERDLATQLLLDHDATPIFAGQDATEQLENAVSAAQEQIAAASDLQELKAALIKHLPLLITDPRR